MFSKTATEQTAAVNPRAPWSLAARLTAWYAASAFLLMLCATGYLYWALVQNLDREDDQYLAAKVQVLRMVLRDRPDDLEAIRQEVVWDLGARSYAAVLGRVLDENGRTILETPGMSQVLSAALFPPPGAADAAPGSATEIVSEDGTPFRVLAVRAFVGQSKDETVQLQLAFDRTFEEALLADYRRNLALVLGLALGVCALVGYQIARRGLRPLAEITGTMHRIRSTTLDERIGATRLPAELSVLAGTFNEMLDRLEESFARLARFSADIAHELRTPVNNIRGEVEVALGKPRSRGEYCEVLGSCMEECGRLAAMIDRLLFLARAESPEAQIARERVDVGRELATVAEYYEAGAGEAGVSLALHCPETLVADLDRTLFQRAVGNLVANALAHTPAGGKVTLRATADSDRVRIEVTDTGPGIAPEHLPHVFDRFYRADQARSTASGRVGLGLAIVKSIAALHQGSATLTSTPGQGTCAALVFPRAATPADPSGRASNGLAVGPRG